MQTVSAAFLAALRGAHRMVVTVEKATSPTGPWTSIPYEVSSGKVTSDRSADARRSLDLTLVGWTDTTAALAAVSPYTTYLRVRRGITLATGNELVTLGCFRVYDAKVTSNSIQVTGYSYEVDLRDRRLTSPWYRNAATTGNLQAEMELIAANAISGATVTFGAGTANPNMGDILVERDRLKGLQDLAQAAGGEFYATAAGQFAVDVPATVTDTPAWSVDSGPEGVLISYTKSYSRGRVYNGVVVSNETANMDTSTLPVRVIVYDNDPASPTYWFGGFGKVPKFYTSEFIVNRAQALTAGASMLSKDRGLFAGIDLDAVPNPALEVNDVVEVVFKDGTSENHVIDTLSISLGADGAMSATSRTSTVEG